MTICVCEEVVEASQFDPIPAASASPIAVSQFTGIVLSQRVHSPQMEKPAEDVRPHKPEHYLIMLIMAELEVWLSLKR